MDPGFHAHGPLMTSIGTSFLLRLAGGTWMRTAGWDLLDEYSALGEPRIPTGDGRPQLNDSANSSIERYKR